MVYLEIKEKIDTPEHCDGCLYNNSGTGCYRRYRNKDGSCPCSICIIKMMCRTTCDAWHSWRLLLMGDRKENSGNTRI